MPVQPLVVQSLFKVAVLKTFELCSTFLEHKLMSCKLNIFSACYKVVMGNCGLCCYEWYEVSPNLCMDWLTDRHDICPAKLLTHFGNDLPPLFQPSFYCDGLVGAFSFFFLQIWCRICPRDPFTQFSVVCTSGNTCKFIAGFFCSRIIQQYLCKFFNAQKWKQNHQSWYEH